MNSVSLAKAGLIVAGMMLAIETFMGSIAALGIGFEPLPILLGLALAMGFPVYLIGLVSLRLAAIGLWVLFLYRWAVFCFLDQPFRLVNPIRLGWSSLLPLAAILVSASFWAFSRVRDSMPVRTLGDVLQEQSARKT